jgi:hypothetical protein
MYRNGGHQYLRSSMEVELLFASQKRHAFLLCGSLREPASIGIYCVHRYLLPAMPTPVASAPPSSFTLSVD